jgi:hypothetical protein
MAVHWHARMYEKGRKVLVRVERDARQRPESRNFDDEVDRQGNMADCPDSRAATGDACECHPCHRHHFPPQVGRSAVVADEKERFFGKQETLSEGVGSWGRSDVMEDVIAGG